MELVDLSGKRGRAGGYEGDEGQRWCRSVGKREGARGGERLRCERERGQGVCGVV